MRSPIERTTLRCLAGLLLLGAVVGCRVTSKDIEQWQRTVKGPGKIVAVLLSPRYPLQLRADAAKALVEMNRSDVDGVAELLKALKQISEKEKETIGPLVMALAPELVKILRQAPPATDGNKRTGPPEVQVRAKDAAVHILSYLKEGEESAAVRDQVIDAVLDWYVADFNGRFLAGQVSAEQVFKQLRGRAAAKLVESLDAKQPPQTLVKLSELIAHFGSAKSKQRAARRLIEIEKEMFSKPYLEWLKKKARQQFEKSGRKPSEKRLEGTVRLTRNKFLEDGVYPAMKHLASDPTLAAYLLQVAALKGNDAFTAARRELALKALAGNVRPEHATKLIALATDKKVPNNVRAVAYDLLPETRNKAVIPKLWPLVEDPKINPQERGQAGSVVLVLGGPPILDEFLQRLPTQSDAKYDPEELAGYAQVISQMSPVPMRKMRRLLTSPHWWARVLALRFLERRGEASDVSRIRRLLSDTTPLVGDHWAPREQKTVGDVAKATLKTLETRLSTEKKAKKPSKATKK